MGIPEVAVFDRTVLKAAGSLLVAVCTWLLGAAFQNDLKQRILLLEDFQRGVLLLHQEIEYLKLPLGEAALLAGKSLREPLSAFFEEVGRELERLPGTPFFMVWRECGVRNLLDTALKEEDLELFWQLGIQLERMEPGGGSAFFGMFEQRLEAALSGAVEEHREKAQLYKRLGMMGGIFLVILLL